MKKRFLSLLMVATMAAFSLAGCAGTEESITAIPTAGTDSSVAEESSDSAGQEKEVLRVGMECAYAPFNWTQETEEVPGGGKAVPIYGTDFYAYGYDVMVAQMLAEEMGMELEIHKVEWDSIGLSMDAGVYDCIIAGMGKTAQRELSYSFTEPYYYRDNCITVKKGSEYESVTGLSELSGKGVKLTTQLGTGWVPLLDQIEGGELTGNYATTAECFMAISNGVADVAVIDLPTAQSAALTNPDLVVITLDEADTFVGDEEMTNVCIATRKDDTEFRDKLQAAMDAIGWNDKAAMDELMQRAIEAQPAAN